jgi:hypothetical protein
MEMREKEVMKSSEQWLVVNMLVKFAGMFLKLTPGLVIETKILGLRVSLELYGT